MYDILNDLPGLKNSKKAVKDAVNCIEELEVKSVKKDKIINYLGEELAKNDKFNNCKEDIIRFAEYETEYQESEDKQ